MTVLNKLMARGIVPPDAHGVLDYPLAAIITAGAIVVDFDWIVRVIPPLLHGYADVTVTVGLRKAMKPAGARRRRPASPGHERGAARQVVAADAA